MQLFKSLSELDINHKSRVSPTAMGWKFGPPTEKHCNITCQRTEGVIPTLGEGSSTGNSDAIYHRLFTIYCLIIVPALLLAAELRFGTGRRMFRQKGYLIEVSLLYRSDFCLPLSPFTLHCRLDTRLQSKFSTDTWVTHLASLTAAPRAPPC